MSYPQRCHASTTTTILYKRIKEQPKAKSRGKRRPNGFSKKTGEPGCLEPGHVQTRDCSSEIGAPVFKKNSGSVRAPWPYARRRTKTRLPRGLAETLWNGRFSTTGCALDVEDFRKTRPARRTQADAPEAVFGHSKKFNPLLPACKRTAHPDQEQPIQSRQEQSRKVMAAGAPGQEDVNQPERFSGLQRTVGLGSCQALGCSRRRVLGVLQACWRGLLAGTAGSGSRHGLRDPAVSSGIRDRATQACREMRQPGNTVAHRLCASSLWAIGKLAD